MGEIASKATSPLPTWHTLATRLTSCCITSPAAPLAGVFRLLNMNTWEQLIQEYLEGRTPKEAWRKALQDRQRREKDQQLANAEHYLWSLQHSQQSPVHGTVGLMMPAGYSAAKLMGLLGQGGSQPTLEQLKAGTMGAVHGLLGRY